MQPSEELKRKRVVVSDRTKKWSLKLTTSSDLNASSEDPNFSRSIKAEEFWSSRITFNLEKKAERFETIVLGRLRSWRMFERLRFFTWLWALGASVRPFSPFQVLWCSRWRMLWRIIRVEAYVFKTSKPLWLAVFPLFPCPLNRWWVWHQFHRSFDHPLLQQSFGLFTFFTLTANRRLNHYWFSSRRGNSTRHFLEREQHSWLFPRTLIRRRYGRG